MNNERTLTEGTGIVDADLLAPMDEQLRRFRDSLRRELAAQLAAGHPVYSGGMGAKAGMLIVHLPDGRICEYRVREDGTHQIMRELPR